VKKLNNSLWDKTFEKDQKIYTPVNMVKDNYVKKSLSLLNNVPAIQNFDYSEINDFCSGTEKVLKDMKNIPPKQAVLLSKYFKGETSRIIKTLKDIENMKGKIKSVLDGKALWLGGEVDSRIERIHGLESKVNDLKKQETTLLEKTKMREKESKEKNRELERFLSGKDFREFEDLGSEIKRLEMEKSNTENELREELAGVKRPLKKLEYSLKQEGKEKSSLVKAAHSPMKVLFREQGEVFLKEALVKLRELMLKDNEKERVEELITKIDNNYIAELRDRYKFLEGDIEDKRERKQTSDAVEKKKTKEREIENLKKEILDYEKERQKISEGMKETTDEIDKEKRKLEEILLAEMEVKIRIE
jgi:hypothetical protein